MASHRRPPRMAAVDTQRVAYAQWPRPHHRYVALPAQRHRHILVLYQHAVGPAFQLYLAKHSHAIMVLVHSSWNSSSFARQATEIICIREQAQDVGRPSETASDAHMAVRTLLTRVDLESRRQLAGNSYTEWTNLDFSALTHLEPWSNKNLTRIDNVMFSSRLIMLDLHDMNITNWIMTTDTFNALNRLQPYYFGLDKEKDDGWGYIGYTYANLTIDSSAAECSGKSGTIQELWGTNKTARQKPYDQSVFRVCVLSGLSDNPPPSPTATTTESSTLSTGVIVGIAAGGAALIGIVVFMVMRRRQVRAEKELKHVQEMYHSTEELPSNDVTGLDMKQLTMCRLDESRLTLHRKLGSGAFADVWLGTYQGESVAVKKMHANRVTLRQLQSFVEEITLMATFDSPYIVKLIGAAWTRPSDVKGVMELMDGGDLKDCLDHNAPSEFHWNDKYMHIHSIVHGLVYLHSLNIIHRDVKSRNVLLDSKKSTKLTDFGVSKEDMQATMTVGVGTFRWMAPEVIQDKSYTTSADIYSFGVILSEFDTHRIPYEDLTNPSTGLPIGDSAILVSVVQGEIQPTFTRDCPPWIFDMAMQCLAHNPDDRPTAMQLSHIIRTKLKEMSTGLFTL
ncbi:hypothetical protein AC1031_000663 [Aphanomyces cochlioides]|nr:hypothetical protein AC1031_000663 [Aphanomyces cochlioides]